MARYRLIIKPCSPFQTPLHSDTLFGHICWALRYLKGEDKLIEFLAAFNADSAPLILSSGFPSGYLPMPVLRPLSDKEEKLLWEKYERGNTRLDFTRELKIFKKVSHIQISAMQMLKDDLSYYNLYDRHLNRDITIENPTVRIDKEFSKTVEVWHNSKNRLNDRVMEGKLFAKSDTFYNNGAELVVYIEDTYFSRDMFLEIIYFIARSGYGADKSSGRGIFEFELLDEWELPESENPNAYLNLSQYHPMEGDFKDEFYYDMTTKFGKIGGHWASGIDGGPYKMPILMLNPGSVFQTDNYRPFYGGIIKNVHKKEGVVHYGIALPLKVRIA